MYKAFIYIIRTNYIFSCFNNFTENFIHCIISIFIFLMSGTYFNDFHIQKEGFLFFLYSCILEIKEAIRERKEFI